MIFNKVENEFFLRFRDFVFRRILDYLYELGGKRKNVRWSIIWNRKKLKIIWNVINRGIGI